MFVAHPDEPTGTGIGLLSARKSSDGTVAASPFSQNLEGFHLSLARRKRKDFSERRLRKALPW
jgi:hypothetical protein